MSKGKQVEDSLVSLVDDLIDKYQMLHDRVSLLTMDINRIKGHYLDIMLQYKEDHKIMIDYLKQDRKFQQWSAKMALSSTQRK
jgi:site-specific DNA-adenine methylase